MERSYKIQGRTLKKKKEAIMENRRLERLVDAWNDRWTLRVTSLCAWHLATDAWIAVILVSFESLFPAARFSATGRRTVVKNRPLRQKRPLIGDANTCSEVHSDHCSLHSSPLTLPFLLPRHPSLKRHLLQVLHDHEVTMLFCLA